MVRDISLLSDEPLALENNILKKPNFLDSNLFKDLKVKNGFNIKGHIGDLVVFAPISTGSYKNMETLWGNLVELEKDKNYIGVLCERGSTKLMSAEFPLKPIPIKKNLILQLIAQAGGIGYVTGFSPQLKKENGMGVACDVKIKGLIYSGSNALNIYEKKLPLPQKFKGDKIPPNILILGTATDVGKTTLVESLVSELSKKYTCAGVKASGTGWYFDSLLHLNAGCSLVLNYMHAGLPTTYYVPSKKYMNAMYSIFYALSNPKIIPKLFIPPNNRNKPINKPNMIITEHGGDLIWANIPNFLNGKKLMQSVFAIIICCESAVSLIGALSELKKNGITNDKVKIYANMPLTNPESFFKRMEKIMSRNEIQGICDINKPKVGINRKNYSIHYNKIYSLKKLVTCLRKDLTNFRTKN